MPDREPARRSAPPRPSAPAERTYPGATIAGHRGRRREVLVLHTSDELDRDIRILADPDFMRAYVHCPTPPRGRESLIEDIRLCLQEAGIRHGIDEESLTMLSELLYQPDQALGPFQVARGTFPRPGNDGRIEFLVQPTTRRAQYDTDDFDRMDFRETHLIENALKGQHVATIQPPGRGRPGKNIFGQPIAAAAGKPADLHLGRGIRLEGDKLFADDDGRLNHDHNVLSLVDTYEVHRDVDYGVGNIDFVGKVEIQGSVLDDFEVRGKQGVIVHGDVGNCRIDSDHDVIIEGGVNGRSAGRITCGGSLQAKYLNGVTVQAGGDIIVQREIVNSTIRSSGCLFIEHGAILGGDIMAFRGIAANVIGSELGVFTRLAAGLDWRTEEKIADLDRSIGRIQEKIASVNEDLEPMLQDKRILIDMAPEQREVMQSLVEDLRQMRNRLADKLAERKDFVDNTVAGQVSQINVNATLHQGVTVRFSHAQMQIRQMNRGPLSVVQNRKNELIRIVAQVPLAEDRLAKEPRPGG